MEKCKDCPLLYKSDDRYVCLGNKYNVFQAIDPEREACEKYKTFKYTCFCCYFFDKGMCKAETGEYRSTTKENVACAEFEYSIIRTFKV